MAYHSWGHKQLNNATNQDITDMYNMGYVLGRLGKNNMNRTRSIRIDLQKFELNSENRRILRKTENVRVQQIILPILRESYDWKIHKLGKDFYTKKFGPKVFSANKIKELVTSNESSFNILLKYVVDEDLLGYAICYQNDEIFHYTFPFYDLDRFQNNYGMGMMLQAILYAQNNNKKYIYLGSATRPADKYKLQFNGLEWFDGERWRKNMEDLKKVIQNK